MKTNTHSFTSRPHKSLRSTTNLLPYFYHFSMVPCKIELSKFRSQEFFLMYIDWWCKLDNRYSSESLFQNVLQYHLAKITVMLPSNKKHKYKYSDSFDGSGCNFWCQSVSEHVKELWTNKARFLCSSTAIKWLYYAYVFSRHNFALSIWNAFVSQLEGVEHTFIRFLNYKSSDTLSTSMEVHWKAA